MTKTIAIAGKGGTGKTTLAAVLAELLSQKGVVLAIDADPSSNLHLTLGVDMSCTVGSAREELLAEVRKGTFPVGMAKQDYLDIRIQESLVEGSRIDLLAMGRPEGPGCYCAANNMIRVALDRIEGNYDFIVIDNEAGMEHISRQTTQDVDVLLLVSDPTVRGIVTAVRMKELIGEIRTEVGRVALVVNRTTNGLSAEVQRLIKENGLDLISVIRSDPAVEEADTEGNPLSSLPAVSPVRLSVMEIAQKVGLI
ncbi:MAG: AAA family ATPase [Dehalococcoidia bacterium]|jgi:CO dehydrogenase maturation factor|nr:AAA family ATPase [Dehalococcoidia bacterium]MDP6782839.1 AAA family ATPase [Dehalococcoidia bacterium]